MPCKVSTFTLPLHDLEGRLIEMVHLANGTLNKIHIYPRELIKAAITYGAAKVILTHTHPSGNVVPSDEDKNCTRQIAAICESMEIKFQDHIIVGHDAFFSFRRGGLLKEIVPLEMCS